MSPAMITAPASLMTDVEVAQLLAVPLRRLRTMARSQQIGYLDLHNSDGPLRFHPDDVAAFIESRRVNPCHHFGFLPETTPLDP